VDIVTGVGPDVGMIMDYETGTLSDPEVLVLFADLIGSGVAWSLQGSYGRTATAFLEAGLITPEGKITGRGVDMIDQYEAEVADG
jgi:hypothetical protein